MALEVELKFPVRDLTRLELVLQEANARHVAHETQCDHYFNHPDRDFGETDEAFRIRCVQSDDHSTVQLTYKGPKLDQQTKTRREIEIPLSGGPESRDLAKEMLTSLGFRSVADVIKRRTTFALEWKGRTVTVTRDEVESLGNFAEIELVVDDSELQAAKDCLLDLAQHLRLGESIRASYLELLLDKTAST